MSNIDFIYNRALVRHLPLSFSKCVKMSEPSAPIEVELAIQQHKMYVEILESLVSEVFEIPADELMPDCCFVEDTAVVIDGKAILTFMGAPSRRGESAPIGERLKEVGLSQVVPMKSSGTLDGGDVLCVGQ